MGFAGVAGRGGGTGLLVAGAGSSSTRPNSSGIMLSGEDGAFGFGEDTAFAGAGAGVSSTTSKSSTTSSSNNSTAKCSVLPSGLTPILPPTTNRVGQAEQRSFRFNWSALSRSFRWQFGHAIRCIATHNFVNQ
jgi:hypothetical protein